MSSILPVNVTGLVLIGLAIALFIVDIFSPTHGVLTAGGIVAFFLGALMLFSHAAPGFGLSLSWIIPATLVTAAFFVFVVGAGLRAQFNPVRAGKETMLGKTVNALSRIDSQGGRVFIEGENWNAVSEIAGRSRTTGGSHRHRRIDVESETKKLTEKNYGTTHRLYWLKYLARSARSYRRRRPGGHRAAASHAHSARIRTRRHFPARQTASAPKGRG